MIKRHCDDVGRDYGEIERTRLGTAFPGTDLGEEAALLAKAGVQHLIYNMAAVHQLDPIREFGTEVIPRVR
ncbi:MAG: LLM class F420-dependent oxidoreductase, partial [Acidimicrobiia bacterium]